MIASSGMRVPWWKLSMAVTVMASLHSILYIIEDTFMASSKIKVMEEEIQW